MPDKAHMKLWKDDKGDWHAEINLFDDDDNRLRERAKAFMKGTPSTDTAHSQDNAPRPEPGTTITYKDSDGSERCNALTQDGTACGAKGRWKPNQYGEGEFWACPKYKTHAKEA